MYKGGTLVENWCIDDPQTVAEHLEKMKKRLLTVYLEAGMEIDETVNKLAKQIDKLDIEIEDLNLDTLKYRILASILDEAGITGLLIQINEWIEEKTRAADVLKLSKVLYLLDLGNSHDMKQYMSRLDEAVRELKSA
jgi:hypothetical protein